jgi:thiamine-monophosphate kinase
VSDKTLAELGENESLRLTIAKLINQDKALVGPGDDAAVVLAPDGRYVVTTDTMVEDHDFKLAWSSGFDLGFKAVSTNLSDVAAMGATPTALLIAIALPQTTKISWLEDFAEGINEAIRSLAPDVQVVGGDLASSTKVFISVTAHGDLQGRAPVLRSGARIGDAVAIAGSLGKAAAGLELLSLSNSATKAFDDLVNFQLRPVPPIQAGIEASVAGATSMLDISDGLIKDASRIAKASDVSIKIRAQDLVGFEAILDQVSQRLEKKALDWILYGGEDHALLATFPKDAIIPKSFKVIGAVIARSDESIYLDDQPLISLGWDSIRG